MYFTKLAPSILILTLLRQITDITFTVGQYKPAPHDLCTLNYIASILVVVRAYPPPHPHAENPNTLDWNGRGPIPEPATVQSDAGCGYIERHLCGHGVSRTWLCRRHYTVSHTVLGVHLPGFRVPRQYCWTIRGDGFQINMG